MEPDAANCDGGHKQECNNMREWEFDPNANVRAGLQFPVAHFARRLKEEGHAPRLAEDAPVYLAAVLEYLCAELTQEAGNAAKDNERARITPRDLDLMFRFDEELSLLKQKVYSPTQAGQGDCAMEEQHEESLIVMSDDKDDEDFDFRHEALKQTRDAIEEATALPDVLAGITAGYMSSAAATTLELIGLLDHAQARRVWDLGPLDVDALVASWEQRTGGVVPLALREFWYICDGLAGLGGTSWQQLYGPEKAYKSSEEGGPHHLVRKQDYPPLLHKDCDFQFSRLLEVGWQAEGSDGSCAVYLVCDQASQDYGKVWGHRIGDKDVFNANITFEELLLKIVEATKANDIFSIETFRDRWDPDDP